jgi:hypothetical protein
VLRGNKLCSSLFANGIVWLITAMLTFILPLKTAAFLILCQGAVALPLAFALERLLKFPVLTKGNALVPLMIHAGLVQIVALPAVILAYVFLPVYVPAVFAAVVGAHLLPYAWLHKSLTSVHRTRSHDLVRALPAGNDPA